MKSLARICIDLILKLLVPPAALARNAPPYAEYDVGCLDQIGNHSQNRQPLYWEHEGPTTP